MRVHNSLMISALALVLTLACGLPLLAQQQVPADSTTRQKLLRKSSFIPVPILYYTPETRWAGGLAALYAFRTRGQSDAARPSQLQLGLAYTQERQVLIYLPFQLFSKDESQQAYGELGYYRYVYQFFGIGNDTRLADEESYSVSFPRLRLNALRLVAPHHYLGLRYWWDNYRITDTQEGGLLAQDDISGSQGGQVSGGGLVWNYDSRDQIFYPTKGFWTEAEVWTSAQVLGSDFNFSRLALDAVGYFSKNEKHVLAVNAWLVYTQGEVPFQQLSFLGGPKKLRGHFEGRFRDNNLWVLQAEYRALIRGRFGATLFGGMGAVSPQLKGLFGQAVHLGFGLGLRFMLSKKDHINLRLDVASNEYGQLFPYLTVREAF